MLVLDGKQAEICRLVLSDLDLSIDQVVFYASGWQPDENTILLGAFLSVATLGCQPMHRGGFLVQGC